MSADNGSGSADLLRCSNNNSKFHIEDRVTVVGIATIAFTAEGKRWVGDWEVAQEEGFDKYGHGSLVTPMLDGLLCVEISSANHCCRLVKLLI